MERDLVVVEKMAVKVGSGAVGEVVVAVEAVVVMDEEMAAAADLPVPCTVTRISDPMQEHMAAASEVQVEVVSTVV